MTPKLLSINPYVIAKQVIHSSHSVTTLPYFKHHISSTTPYTPQISNYPIGKVKVNPSINISHTQPDKFFKKFHNLDDIPPDTAHFLINSMQVMEQFPSIQKIKKDAIINMLRALPKDKYKNILEVGCGHGADAKIIAKYLDNGKVTAIDSSYRMIQEAVNLSPHPKITYKNVNVNDMAENGNNKKYFDACHADRLLVSSPDYKILFQNMISLVKPNGIITITDVDALSIVLYPYNNITKIILEQLQSDFVNPFMARELPALFIDNWLQDIEVTSSVSMVRNFEQMRQIFQFEEIIASAIHNGKITKKEGVKWIDNMKQASESGKFMYSVQFCTVQGRIPLKINNTYSE